MLSSILWSFGAGGVWGLCKGKPPHHRAPGSADVGSPQPVCGEQQCYMEYKGHFSLRVLRMLKELGAWGKAPQRVPYGWAGACPVPFRDSSRILLSAE